MEINVAVLLGGLHGGLRRESNHLGSTQAPLLFSLRGRHFCRLATWSRPAEGLPEQSKRYPLPKHSIRHGDEKWGMVFSGLLRRVALVRTDVSEEPGASFIRVTKNR
jgi:hypothetical protein